MKLILYQTRELVVTDTFRNLSDIKIEHFAKTTRGF